MTCSLNHTDIVVSKTMKTVSIWLIYTASEKVHLVAAATATSFLDNCSHFRDTIKLVQAT